MPEGTDHAVVDNYMAHHQGMSIVAVANVVFEGAACGDRFHSDPVIEAGGAAAAGEGAARHSGGRPVRTEADERVKADAWPSKSPDTRLVLNPPQALRCHQSDVERPLLRDGDGDRLGLQPLATTVAVTRWQRRSDRGPAGHLPVPDRHRDRANGGRRRAEPKTAPGRDLQTLFRDDKATFVKAVGTLRSRGRVHRRRRKAMARPAASDHHQ